MDPLTAIGLAGNIVQFVDFSSKLLGGAYEVYSSATGATAETADLGTVIQDLQAVTRRLSPPSSKPRTDDEIALSSLVSNCRKLSDDILKVLNKLQSRNPHQKWASLQVAWASMRKKEKLASLETRLNRYRSEILFRISIMMKEEQSSVRTALEKISQHDETSAKKTREELGKLKEDILQGVELLLHSHNRNDARASLDHQTKTLKDIRIALSDVAEATTTIAKEDWILKRLRFDSMYSREDSIVDAHSKTFKWLLQDPKEDPESASSIGSHPSETSSLESYSDNGMDRESEIIHKADMENATKQDLGLEQDAESSRSQHSKQGDEPNSAPYTDSTQESETVSFSEILPEPELRKYARSSFIEWLRCGSGIFYISGKAGSGKSTLMKFLVQQRRTRDELTVWAREKKLVFAHFFFWNSGTDMQKSLEGLYRSILFEALRECPDLMRDVFPKPWKAASSFKDSESSDQTFRFPQILAAFDNLVKSTRLFSSHKFCFFIDGLDEYAGDHWKMAKSLKTWTTSPDIKICVSSRPHNEFEESFSRQTNLRLKLQELTKEDMEQFVNDEFDGDERFLRVQHNGDEYRKLRDRIVELADGVFLWVRLATHTLLTGLCNDFSLSELEEKLESIPTGLNDFFRKMWDSIDYSDRPRAARTFLVATHPYLEYITRLNMLTYSFLDDLDENNDFADEIYTREILAITGDEIQERLRRTRQRLAGRCKGLLEITDDRSSDPFFRYRVSFLHRTVSEFLVQEDMQKELKKRVGNFTMHLSLSLAFLAQIKAVPTMSPRFPRTYSIFHLVDNVVRLAVNAEAEGSNPLLRELETLYNILGAYRDILAYTEEARDKFGRISWWCGHLLGGHRGLSVGIGNSDWGDFSLIHNAAYAGHFGFVSRKISVSTDNLELRSDVNLLVSASLGAATNFSRTQAIKLTKFLFDRGVSPNEQLSGTLIGRHPAYCGNLIWTPWALLLLGSVNSVHKSRLANEFCHFFDVIELFLRNGADASICLLGYQVKDVKGKQIVVNGPSYMTLDQFVEIWAPINAEAIRGLLKQKSLTTLKNWLNWMTISFRREQQGSTTNCYIKHFEFDEIQGSYFAVTSIGSITTLDQLTPSEIQVSAEVIQREDSGITELKRYDTLSIRVS